MRHFLILLVVALLTIGIILWIKRPDILGDIWLWLVGLAGTIGGIFKSIIEWINTKFGGTKQAEKAAEAALNPAAGGTDAANLPAPAANALGTAQPAAGTTANQPASAGAAAAAQAFAAKETQYKQTITDLQQQVSSIEAALQAEKKAREAEKATHPASDFNGTTITVLRYWRDDDTTLGLLFINYQYFAYTLEDGYHKIKVPGKTRIPAGTYNLAFNKADTNLTKRYRKASWIKDIFDYHIMLQNVPNYSGVYVHNGGTSNDTEGCLLVSDQINVGGNRQALTNSRKTFRSFYQLIGNKLRNNEAVRIIIKDENWFKNHFLRTKAA